jgi:chromosome segregation ATPase
VASWIFIQTICYSKAHNLSSSLDMEGEEELKALRARVRNLERSLAESEALSLQQIECIHRLEHQLLEAQAQIQERDQALQACQEEKARLAQRPTPEAFQLQQQHIEELQNLLWEMERRPTLEHYHILQQQLQTSQTEIETLKAELQRRVDPARFYQLQQELLELKQQANQLGEYAVKLPQVQLLQAQLQLRVQQLEEEKAQLQAQIQELAARPSAQELETLRAELEAAHRQAEAEWQRLKTHLETEKAHMEADLNTARQRIRELEERPTPEQWARLQAELDHLRQQASFAKAERATLLEELQQSQRQQAEQAQQIAKLEAEAAQAAHLRETESSQAQRILALEEQVQALTRELGALRAERDQLMQELAQRPTLAQWQEVQQQVQDTRESLEAARRGRELAEAHHLVSQKQIEKLQQQVMALKTECVQAHAYAQTQEKEVALLQQRNQELEEQLATLRQSASASPQPAVVEPRSNHPASAPHRWRDQERIPAAADESAPSPATTWRTPTPGIPPLTLDEREESAPLGWRQRTERLLKRSALAASRAGGETGSRNRIELPTFVQRRPY